MFRTHLKSNIPSVREIEIGTPETGEWNLSAIAENPTSNTLELAALLFRYEKAGLQADAYKSIQVPPGGRVELRLAAQNNSSLYRILVLVLRDQKTGIIYHARRLMGQKGMALGRRPNTGVFEISGIGTGQIFFYPGFHKVAVEFRASRGVTWKYLAMQVANSAQKKFQLNNGTWKVVMNVPAAPDAYPLNFEVADVKGTLCRFPAVFTLNTRSFPWENNRLGLDRIILPPFQKLWMADNVINTITSARKINNLGLYDSLRTGGHELLAAPMAFQLTVDGKTEKLTASPLKLRLSDDGYDAISHASVRSASGIIMNITGKLEYDGFHWLKLKLEAAPERIINRLMLTIPLKSEEVPLFHAVANNIRTNPGGTLPTGEGLLWGGGKLSRRKYFGEEVIHPQLVPYIWLGAETTGLSWFIDSSFGFKLDRKCDALRISRHNGTVMLEIDIINMPLQLKCMRTIEFGFQPTPVKPLTDELRRMLYDAEGVAIPKTTRGQFVFPTWLGNYPPWSKLPFRNDFSQFSAIMSALKSGAALDWKPVVHNFRSQHDIDFFKVISGLPGGTDFSKRIKELRDGWIKYNLENPGRGASFSYAYFDPRLDFKEDEAVKYYKSEWWNPAPQNYFGVWRTTLTQSHIDYQVYCYDRALEHGLHGIYLDDVFLMPDNNPDTLARIDDEGEVHSDIGILALRKLINRVAVIQHQRGKIPRILQVHMTDALLIPCFAQTTSQLGFEDKYGETPLPTRYTPDYIRTVGLGTKLGVNSLMLSGIHRKTTPLSQWAELVTSLKRSQWALALPHGIRHFAGQGEDIHKIYRKLAEFGVFSTDCLFIPYWDQTQTLKVSGGVLLSSYSHQNITLIILSNYFNADQAKVELSGKLPQKFSLVDFESNENVSPREIYIKGYDFRILILTPLDN